MPKWFKLTVGLLLIPVCLGAIRTLWRVLHYAGTAETVWVAFVAGAAIWVGIFVLLPKPMWLYVVGHELTHVVWTWLFGGRVKRFRASAKGGDVVVTKNNFLISLAPYFFPLYAALIILAYVLGHLIWDWQRYVVWFHFLLGAAYAFHVTLTWHILQTRQTDITSQGYLFCAVIIFLGNIGVLLVGLPLLTSKLTVLTTLGWWLAESGQVLVRLSRLL